MKKKKVIQFISNSSGFYSLCDDRTWKRVASSKTSTPPSTRKKEKWIQTSENGTTITFDKAVAILWGANNYLAQHKGENCTSGGCFVCAMNFFSHNFAHAVREETIEVIEQLRVQLAGCLTAAEGFTKNPAKQGDYGWSVAYQKVLELRKRFNALSIREGKEEV